MFENYTNQVSPEGLGESGVAEREMLEEEKEDYDLYTKDLDFAAGDLKGKKILDIGSGPRAGFMRYCLRNGITKEIYASDYRGPDSGMSPEFRAHFFAADAENLPLAAAKFDLLILRAAPVDFDFDMILPRALAALKSGGELRIAPVFGDGPAEKSIQKALVKLPGGSFETSQKETQVVEDKRSGEKWSRGLLIIRKT